jgi:hypothetical protein
MLWKWWLTGIPVVALLVFITHEAFGLWPSLGFFTLVYVCAGFIYRQDSRGLIGVLKPLAQKYGGELDTGTPLSYPQLRFEAAARRYCVRAMPNAGASVPAGPFTLVQLTLPFDSVRQAEVKRTPALIRGAVAALAPEWQAPTGDTDFNQVFRIEGRDQAVMVGLLDDGLRERLLASPLPDLRLRLRDATITVIMDGLAKTVAEVEEMIDLADAFADRCADPAGQRS